MDHPIGLKLTCVGLLVLHANHYTTRGTITEVVILKKCNLVDFFITVDQKVEVKTRETNFKIPDTWQKAENEKYKDDDLWNGS